MSIGSLYQYFPGKDALIGALLDRQIKKNLAEVEKSIRSQRGASLGEALDDLCGVVVDLFIVDAPFFRQLFTIAPHLGKVENIVRSRADAERLFFDLLRSHSPDASETDLRAKAFISVHSVMGVIQYCGLAGLPEGWDRARLARELRPLLRGYLL